MIIDNLINIFILKLDVLFKVFRTFPTLCLGPATTPLAFIKKTQKIPPHLLYSPENSNPRLLGISEYL